MRDATVIGGGLAGCEAAWALANAGHRVTLYEMKPEKYSPAHKSPGLADTKKSLRKTPQACTIFHETHPDQAVAFSSFFMIEKMKSADTRHSTIRMLHSTHRGRPPHSMPMMATM